MFVLQERIGVGGSERGESRNLAKSVSQTCLLNYRLSPRILDHPTQRATTRPWPYPCFISGARSHSYSRLFHLNPQRPWGRENTKKHNPYILFVCPSYKKILGQCFSKCMLYGLLGESIKIQAFEHLSRESDLESLG